jgi:Protein of unknown function (DUF3043)
MPSLRKKPVPEPEPETVEKLNGKGRATPTRKEAQASRRVGASTRRAVTRSGAKANDPKAARIAVREARREKAAEYRKAMASGDVSRLPARERVPERIMARDIVDERRNIGPLALGTFLLLYVVSLAPVGPIRFVTIILFPVCVLAIAGDSIYVARKAARLVREKYPNTTVKVKGYSGQRAMMPARWRQPRPRPGIKVGRWIPRGQ